MEEHSIINERAITTGSILNERYEIKRTLGEGGFGITYEAVDVNNNGLVCIKEYFPAELALREHVDSTWNLHLFSGEKRSLYERGLKRFLNESEILKNFQYLDGIVTVMDSFQENNTAYIVMEYIDGITLKQYIEENGRLTYREITDLIKPVMGALIKLHRQGLIHRDISPDNLMIGLDNKLRLIDFGSAETTEIADEKTRTIILKSGFAPPEQYVSDGKQGPWTDVYALAATIYTAITGSVPVSSVGRLQGKELPSPESQHVALEKWQWRVIRRGLSINIADRYRDMESFLEAMTTKPSLDLEKTSYRVGEADKSEDKAEDKIADSSEDKAKDKTADRSEAKAKDRTTDKTEDKAVSAYVHDEEKNSRVRAGNRKSIYAIFGVVAVAVILMITIIVTRALGEKNTVESSGGQSSISLCTMPQVTGFCQATARDKILNADNNLQINIVWDTSDSVARGNVINQSVAANTQYNEGAINEITLTISLGIDGTALDEESEQSTEAAVSSLAGDTDEDTNAENSTQKTTTEEATQREVVTEKTTQDTLLTEESTQKEVATENTTQKEVTTEKATQKEATTEKATQKEATTEKSTQKDTSSEKSTAKSTTEKVTTTESSTEEEYGFDIVGDDDYVDIDIE